MTNKMCSICGRTLYSIKLHDKIYGNVCAHCANELVDLKTNYITREDRKGQLIYETCIPIDRHSELDRLIKALKPESRASITKALEDAHKRYIMRPIDYQVYSDKLLILYSGRYRSSLVLIEFTVSDTAVYLVKAFSDAGEKIMQTRQF